MPPDTNPQDPAALLERVRVLPPCDSCAEGCPDPALLPLLEALDLRRAAIARSDECRRAVGFLTQDCHDAEEIATGAENKALRAVAAAQGAPE